MADKKTPKKKIIRRKVPKMTKRERIAKAAGTRERKRKKAHKEHLRKKFKREYPWLPKGLVDTVMDK